MDQDDRTTRRAFLATATAISGSIAGCSLGDGGTGNSTGSPTTEPDSSPGGTDEPGENTPESVTATDGTPTGGGREGRIVTPAIERGQVLDDFTDKRWYGLRQETISLDQENAISGKYALRIENEGNRLSTVAFAPTTSISLEGKNLSMAVKIESPVGGRLEARLRAPNKENRYVCTRHLPPNFSDWMRIDLGITRGWNDPDITNIGEMRIEIEGQEDEGVKYWIDDVRTTEAVSTPHAILAFYGGLDSHYETAFQKLEERGMKGAVPVRPAAVGNDGRMGIGKLRELRDAGWDVCNFPMRGTSLPEMSAEQQREVILQDQEVLRTRGFPDGSRQFFAPHHSVNRDTVEILRETHDTGFLAGGSSVGVVPTSPYLMPTINGNDYDSSRAVVLRANRHNQVVVLGFDEIGTEEGMSVSDFEAQLDRIENNSYAGGLNVITPSEFAKQYF